MSKLPYTRYSTKRLFVEVNKLNAKAERTVPLFWFGMVTFIIAAIAKWKVAMFIGSACCVIDIVNCAYYSMKLKKITNILFTRGFKHGRKK